jgi:hypothetical protein
MMNSIGAIIDSGRERLDKKGASKLDIGIFA